MMQLSLLHVMFMIFLLPLLLRLLIPLLLKYQSVFNKVFLKGVGLIARIIKNSVLDAIKN